MDLYSGILNDFILFELIKFAPPDLVAQARAEGKGVAFDLVDVHVFRPGKYSDSSTRIIDSRKEPRNWRLVDARD